MIREDARGAERDLALRYAPLARRDALAALWALDDALGDAMQRSRDPMVVQFRMTWWRESLQALDRAMGDRATGRDAPILRALGDHVLPCGVTGPDLTSMIDGWEVLLDEDTLDEAALDRFARLRGAGLFAAAARVCGLEDSRTGALGQGWALADLSAHVSDGTVAVVARDLAERRLATGLAGALPPGLRTLGAMALLARADLTGRSPPGSPRRVARLLAHRLTGR